MSSVIGSFSGAVTSWKMGAEQKKTAYRQATYYERQGRLTTEKAEQEATAREGEMGEDLSQTGKALEKFYGTQRAKYSSSGITRMEGSPQEVMKASMKEGDEELQRIKYWGETEAAQIRYWGSEAAKSYGIMAYETRKAGRLAQKAGQMAAWGGVAQGVGGIASYATGGSILGG